MAFARIGNRDDAPRGVTGRRWAARLEEMNHKPAAAEVNHSKTTEHGHRIRHQ